MKNQIEKIKLNWNNYVENRQYLSVQKKMLKNKIELILQLFKNFFKNYL